MKFVLLLALLFAGPPAHARECRDFFGRVASGRAIAPDTWRALGHALDAGDFATISGNQDLRYALSRLLFDPTFEWTPAQASALGESYAGGAVLGMYAAAKGIVGLVSSINDFIGNVMATTGGPLVTAHMGQTWTSVGTRALADGARFLLAMVNPLPTDRPAVGSRTEPIYRKLWHGFGKYAPTPAEIKILQEEGQLETFHARKAFLLDHPMISRGTYGVEVIRKLFLLASLGAGANLLGTTATAPDGIIGFDDFLKNSDEGANEEEVQIFTETTPYPHTAIRIGDATGGKLVYRFGLTSLTATPVAEYLQSGSDGPFARSVQIATLRLGRAEVQRVRRALEMRMQQDRKDQSVQDFSSMVLRSLKVGNRFYDASPSQLMMMIAVQKRSGDPRVRRLVQLSPWSRKWNPALATRNAGVNALDSAVFIRTYGYNQAARALFISRYADDWLTTLSRDAEVYFEREARERVRRISDDPALATLERKVTELSTLKGDARRAALDEVRGLQRSYFGGHRDKARKVLAENGAPHEDWLGAKAQIEFLERKEVELVSRLSKLVGE